MPVEVPQRVSTVECLYLELWEPLRVQVLRRELARKRYVRTVPRPERLEVQEVSKVRLKEEMNRNKSLVRSQPRPGFVARRDKSASITLNGSRTAHGPPKGTGHASPTDARATGASEATGGVLVRDGLRPPEVETATRRITTARAGGSGNSLRSIVR